MAAASISTLAGRHAGTVGRVFDTGAATVDTTTCTITVAANGNISVASGSTSAKTERHTGKRITLQQPDQAIIKNGGPRPPFFMQFMAEPLYDTLCL